MTGTATENGRHEQGTTRRSKAQFTPHSPRAEQAALGGLLINTEHKHLVLDGLDADDFFVPAHQTIFRAMLRAQADGVEHIDSVAVVERLSQTGQLEEIGGPATIDALQEAVPVGVSETTVAQHVKSITDHATRRRMQQRIADAVQAVNDPMRSNAEIRSICDLSDVAPPVRQKERFPLVTVSELAAADTELEWLVQDVLVANEPCTVAGARKCLKTSVALDLAMSLASGLPFLGRWQVPRAVRTIFLSGESGMRTLRETAVRIAWAKKANPKSGAFDMLHMGFTVPRLLDPADIAKLRDLVVGWEAEVLIVDPLYLALAGIADKASNLFAMGDALYAITGLAQDTGCTPILAHHCSKRANRKENEVPELDDMTMSGPAEWSRQWILLGRKARYDAEQAGEHKLWLSIGGSAGHSSLWVLDVSEGVRTDPNGRRWDVRLTPPSQSRSETAASEEEEKDARDRQRAAKQLEGDKVKARAVLERHPEGETKTTLRDLAHLNGGRFTRAVQSLVDDGEAEPCTLQKNRQKLAGYRPARTTRTSPDSPGHSGLAGEGRGDGRTLPL